MFSPRNLIDQTNKPASLSLRRWSTSRLTVGALSIVLTATLCTFPASADLQDDIEKASAIDESAEDQPTDLDIATADITQITEQLKALNRQVNASNATKKKLSAEREQSEGDAEDLTKEISETETKIVDLERDLAKKAVTSFQRQTPGSSVLLSDEDPSDSIRKRKLSSSATKSEVETAEELRQAKADLAAKENARGELEEKLAADAKQNEENLAKFESARKAVASLAQDAEERAERVLAEADALGQLDEAEADVLREGVKELNEQVRIVLGPEAKKAEEEAKANPSSVQVPTERAVQGDMRQVQGIWVHKDIADQVDAMLNAARADGIELSGGGFRDPAGQIAVRKSNCGTSNYAIYQMPASSCRPPTARPGRSMHEQGKAIDITYNGSIIKSRSSAAFVWLAANAETYGLFNLPSEPWHWSTNGR